MTPSAISGQQMFKKRIEQKDLRSVKVTPRCSNDLEVIFFSGPM